jgi:hypothetical protein
MGAQWADNGCLERVLIGPEQKEVLCEWKFLEHYRDIVSDTGTKLTIAARPLTSGAPA